METAVDALEYDFLIVEGQEQIKEAEKFFYSEDIKEKLQTGSSIVLHGIIRPECKRFMVNLESIKGTKGDIAFHINPRLALRYIVRNSRVNNCWGDEETTSITKFCLCRNKPFELQIVCTEREFYVSLDGRHICAYVYRIPLENINKLQVEGFVDVQRVEYKQVAVYPTPSQENVPLTVPAGSGEVKLGDQQLTVPITASLPNGFKCGWQLEIAGRVKILPSAFYINLQEGQHLWPHPVIPLHLNPRFYTSYGNHLFVRNSWSDGEWGSEERSPGLQFTPGSIFNLAIRRLEDHFAVWIDGQLAGEFKFRIPADNIDTLFVHGDVQIYSIYLKDHIDDKYFSKSREKVHRL